jgi:holo-[acyl-carrier protein] synthase
MRLIGHGIDLVDVSRIGKMIDDHAQRFLDRCFTPQEQAYASASHYRRLEHLAGRFAAKEAVLKALGTGWRHGIAWTDIEIAHSDAGQPIARLSGQAQRFAQSMGIASWLVSISHTDTHAIASAIAMGE